MSLIKTVLMVCVIAAIIVGTPMLWEKQSAQTRKQVVSWLPRALLPEEPKPNVDKVTVVSKPKPQVYESHGHQGEVEFSDGRSMTRTAHVRVVKDAQGTMLYTHASDKKND